MFQFRIKIASFGRYFGAATLLLTLGLAGCEQPQALPVAAAPLPATSAQPDRYYLNAQLASKEVVELLNPQSITRLDVLKGQQAADYAHDAGVRGVVLVQTR